MSHIDRQLLKKVYGLTYKEQSVVLKIIKEGYIGIDVAAKRVLKERGKVNG